MESSRSYSLIEIVPELYRPLLLWPVSSPHQSPGRWSLVCFHLTDEEAEAQRREVICPRLWPSLSLRAAASKGRYEDSLRWYVGSTIVIINIPWQNSGFLATLRPVTAEVPKLSCAIEISGVFDKNLGALVPQPSKESDSGGLEWARGLLLQLFGGFF